MKKFFTALLASMLLVSIAEAGEIETIGHGIDSDSAVRNALRAAIEQELGAIVDSRTLTQNHQLIELEIKTASSGFVESYEVLSQQIVNGIYEAVVRANVRSEKLRAAVMSKLQKKHLVETTMDDPRIKVLAVDPNGNELLDVENEFIAALQSQGFSRMIINTDDADYIANILVDGSKVAARLLGANSGEVIYSQTFGINRRLFTDTRQWALKNVARLLATAALEHAAQIEQHVKILIEAARIDRNALASRLKTFDGVNNVFVRNLNELDVNFDGTASDLATLLERDGFVIRELSSELIKI